MVTRILDAAQSEFLSAGFVAGSTNRITEAFGGSKATLFRYFPTKESLLEAVIRRVAANWQDRVTPGELDGSEPRQWLETFTARVLEWITSKELIAVGRLGIAEGDKFPKLANVFRETAGEPLRAALESQFQRWTGQGLLKSQDPGADAQHFIDLAISGVVSRALYRQPAMSSREKAAHVQRTVSLFLHGRG